MLLIGDNEWKYCHTFQYEWTVKTSYQCKRPKDRKDLLLYNSTIWSAQNRQIFTEPRLVVFRDQGRGETGVIATKHDISLWNEENVL